MSEKLIAGAYLGIYTYKDTYYNHNSCETKVVFKLSNIQPLKLCWFCCFTLWNRRATPIPPIPFHIEAKDAEKL